MKKNNNIHKKAFVLLEAVVAIILLLFALVLAGETFLVNTKTNATINEAILKLNAKNTFNQINYIKETLMEKGKNTFYAKNNEKYAGWNILKITPNQTLNDLNGYYKINETNLCNSTSIGDAICLQQLGSGQMGFYRIKGDSYKTQIDNSGKVKNINNSNTSKDIDCDVKDLGDSCLGYRLYIENLNNPSAYKKTSYIRSDGVTIVLNSNKIIVLELIGENEKTIKKYKTLLNIN